VWDADSGEGYTNIEPEGEADINDVCVWPNSGLIMVGCDSGELEGREGEAGAEGRESRG
jgi:ribosome biogenesis protein ENP2